MRTRFIVTLGVIGAIIFSACSSAGDLTKKNKGPATGSNSNTTVITNGAEPAGPQRADANAISAPGEQVAPVANSVQQKMDAMKKADTGAPPMDAAEIAAKNSRPAPENSTFTSYLTDAGYEVRTWKNHPQLLKVEKKTMADGAQTLKVYLRNGRVVELPGQRINPLSTATSAFIVEMASEQLQSGKPATAAPPKKEAN